jgi:hypothetical protein
MTCPNVIRSVRLGTLRPAATLASVHARPRSAVSNARSRRRVSTILRCWRWPQTTVTQTDAPPEQTHLTLIPVPPFKEPTPDELAQPRCLP